MNFRDLSQADLRWLSEAVLDLYACDTESRLHACVLPLIHHHFRGVNSQIEELTFDLATYIRHALLGQAKIPPEFLAALQDSPIAVRVLDASAGALEETHHLQRLASSPRVERTNFGQYYMRPNQCVDQLIGTMNSGTDTLWAFGANRDTPFSEGERALFECVRVHTRAALLRIRRSQTGPKLRSSGEVFLGTDGTPNGVSEELAGVLRSYFPADLQAGSGGLPEELKRWVASVRVRLSERPPLTLFCWRSTGPRGRLTARYFPNRHDNGARLRFLEELRVPSTLDLRVRGLTTRECEILHWILEGKRDGEIATVFGMAPRTATKHVERLRKKTGSRTRVGVAAVGQTWLEQLSRRES